MKLRLRLAVAVVVVTAPMIATIVWLDARARQHAADDELARLVMDRVLRDEERARCEAIRRAGRARRHGRPA